MKEIKTTSIWNIILESKKITPNEKIVLSVISRFSGGCGFYASVEALADFCGISVKTAERAKKKLKDLGLIVAVGEKNTAKGQKAKCWKPCDWEKASEILGEKQNNAIEGFILSEKRENGEVVEKAEKIAPRAKKQPKTAYSGEIVETKKQKTRKSTEKVQLIDSNGEIYERTRRSVEIDEVEAIFEEIMGAKVQNSSQRAKDRRAVNAMLNRKGYNVEVIKKLILISRKAYGDNYAPAKAKIRNLSDLMYNTDDVLAYARSKTAVENENFIDLTR